MGRDLRRGPVSPDMRAFLKGTGGQTDMITMLGVEAQNELKKCT